MNMKKIGLLLFILLLGVSLQSCADRVETTGGTVYKGQIIEIDKNELVIKTFKGTTRIPRSNVKSFRSEPFNILSGRVNVQAIFTESWTYPTGPNFYFFDILVTHDKKQFKTGTGIYGPRNIAEAVTRIKKLVGWKDNYLFVTEDCGGGVHATYS